MIIHLFEPFLAIMGWDDIAMLFVKAAASAAASKAVASALPQNGMTTPGQSPSEQPMDLSALLSSAQQQQAKQELPKLQLQNRLPRQY